VTSPSPAPQGAHKSNILSEKTTVFFVPPEPTCTQDLGLDDGMLEALVLRFLALRNNASASDMVSFLRIPYFGVLANVLRSLRDTHWIEVLRGEMLELQWVYAITDAGRTRAQQLFEQCAYVGPAPVSLKTYTQSVRAQDVRGVLVTEAKLRAALSGLILDDSIVHQLGPAVNSGRSLFLYGPPGNGKTMVCERIVQSLGGAVYVPYAIEAFGQIIRIFDEHNHVLATEEEDSRVGLKQDRRFILVRRPMLITGGDLTLESLDLKWNPEHRFYEAPLQLKCNGGALMIDDFGRQQMDPKSLLNRWIVPLEKRIDYLTLHTGTKFEVPFDQLVVFSTNLNPHDLVDDAFLRRIRYKIPIQPPTEENFVLMWQAMARKLGFPDDPRWPKAFMERHLKPTKRPMQGCQPRDILEYIADACRYRQLDLDLTDELIDDAATAYFVDVRPEDYRSPHHM
jgi:DNA-binding PadR family transcriptional regulator